MSQLRLNKSEKIINNSVSKCLFYHSMCLTKKSSPKLCSEEERNSYKKRLEAFKEKDTLNFQAGGQEVPKMCHKLMKDPLYLSSRITRELVQEFAEFLVADFESPADSELGYNKRRQDRKVFERFLIYFYAEKNLPVKYFDDNHFSYDHIIPFSSRWSDQEKLDNDRLGNIIPVPLDMNSKRQNHHIDEYKKMKKYTILQKHIPMYENSCKVYNDIVKHGKNKDTGKEEPRIIDIQKYNEMCRRNEKAYIDNFVEVLFSQSEEVVSEPGIIDLDRQPQKGESGSGLPELEKNYRTYNTEESMSNQVQESLVTQEKESIATLCRDTADPLPVSSGEWQGGV